MTGNIPTSVGYGVFGMIFQIQIHEYTLNTFTIFRTSYALVEIYRV